MTGPDRGKLRQIVWLAVAGFALLVSTLTWSSAVPVSRGPRDIPVRDLAPGASPSASEYWLEPGYRLELVAGQLTFPTAIAFGPRGELYVAEAGYSHGPVTAIPRILQILRGGQAREIARLPDGPITSLAYHEGFLYAIGGRAPAEIWRIEPNLGQIRTVVTGLAVWGRHYTSELVFGSDGRMYFGVGSPSNSGVMGPDDYHMYGHLAMFPEARDIAAVELKLKGTSLTSANPLRPGAQAQTGAFKAFGEPGIAAETLPAGTPPEVTGVILRANPDGTELEVVASGFRNVYGLGFAPDGRLFAIDQGMDDAGIRPVAAAPDTLWNVEYGGWYGYPDYVGGLPVSDESLRPATGPAPELLLADHPPLAGQPYHLFTPGASSQKFVIATDERFGLGGRMFLAQFGPYVGGDGTPPGHRIVRFNLETRAVRDFYVNLVPGPGGAAPERPTAVIFGPDGCLYIVDFGNLTAEGGVVFPSALTGAVWRISPRRVIMGGEDAAAPGTVALTALMGLGGAVLVLVGLAMAQPPGRRRRGGQGEARRSLWSEAWPRRRRSAKGAKASQGSDQTNRRL